VLIRSGKANFRTCVFSAREMKVQVQRRWNMNYLGSNSVNYGGIFSWFDDT
jgi:hypothetical protein